MGHAFGSVADLYAIWLKFRMITHRKVFAGRHASKLEPEVELCRQRRVWNSVFEAYLRHRSKYLRQIWYVGKNGVPNVLNCFF